jgi:O-antigen ligase
MTQKNSRFPFLYWAFLIYSVLSLSAMAFMSIGVSLLIVAVVFDRGGPKRFYEEFLAILRIEAVRTYGIASLLFCIACFVSLICARFFPLAFAGKSTPIHLLRDMAKTWYLLLPLILLIGWRRLLPDQKTTVFKTWFIFFGILSAVGVVQFFTGLPRAQANPQLPGYYHVVLLLGHHLSVASIWIFPFFAILDVLFDRDSIKKLKIPFPILLLFFGLGSFSLFFSYSRTLWVAMPVGLILWVWIKLPRKFATWGTVIAISLGIILYQTPQFKYRMQSQIGISQRTELWTANLEFLKARPMTGVGLGKNHELSLYYFQQKYPHQTDFFIGHAHNIYLEMISGLGLFGFFAWILWLTAAICPLVRSCKNKLPLNFSHGFLAAWTVFLINGVTQVNFWDGKVLHQVMWVTSLALLWSSDSKNVK